MSVPSNKVIMGKEAFSHDSSILQGSVVKDPETYEIMYPNLDREKATELPHGKLSGKHVLQDKLKQHGYDIDLQEQKL
ncbi:hypothetical protein DV965_14575 [Staphylococcus pseudintermedius]|uniref:homocitrate synthase/isopropylmalate synthase family protein n=1 Tax=Staphylococcus pseudintermedius TaxID=283734 RepID=UPI000E37BD7B|nr:hypothetical protein [Staphylococcus pseudintermedius]REB90685.1 hypothetical protein DV965_14575 [Staphylococcus pseudintermedius]